MTTDKLKVVYVAGYSRCGSTILSNVLGEIPGWFNAGELMYLWNRMSSPDGICGCGAHVTACGVWKPILDGAFGSPPQVDCAKMISLRNDHWRTHKIPGWLISSGARSRLRVRLSEYLPAVERLYREIAAKAPGRVLIDSSKNPAYLFWLSLLPNLELHVVHIVRDARANAYSWLTAKAGFAQRSAVASSLAWAARNALLMRVGRQVGQTYQLVRYEDFIAHPSKTLQQIATVVTPTEQPSLDFIAEDGVALGTNHCVYGNTDLFKTGKIKLKVDDRWRNMRASDRFIVTSLTWPILRRFGYALTI